MFRMDKLLTCIFYVFCSLFKSYKPECVPEKIPAVNIQVAFKAAGKMNPFFQQARLRLGAGNVDQGNAEMVKWNIDQGVKRVSVDAAVHNDISTSNIAALLLVFAHPNDFLSVAIEVFENSVLKGIFRPQRRDKTGSWESCIMRCCIIVYVFFIK